MYCSCCSSALRHTWLEILPPSLITPGQEVILLLPTSGESRASRTCRALLCNTAIMRRRGTPTSLPAQVTQSQQLTTYCQLSIARMINGGLCKRWPIRHLQPPTFCTIYIVVLLRKMAATQFDVIEPYPLQSISSWPWNCQVGIMPAVSCSCTVAAASNATANPTKPIARAASWRLRCATLSSTLMFPDAAYTHNLGLSLFTNF